MHKYLLSLGALLIAAPIHALDTGWLEPSLGHRDAQSGASVESINFEGDNQVIRLSIPKSHIKALNQDAFAPVVVVARSLDNQEEPVEGVSYEWAKDFVGDYYGLIIKLKHNSKMPFRLYFARDEGSNNP